MSGRWSGTHGCRSFRRGAGGGCLHEPPQIRSNPVTQDPDHHIPQELVKAASSARPGIRREGLDSLLPGTGGLTPWDEPAIAKPATGFSARAWSARRWWLAPVFTLLGAAAWPFVRGPEPAVAPKFTTHALVRYETTEPGSGAAGNPDRTFVDIVRTELQLIAEPQNCALAARNGELQHAIPALAKQNLDDPTTQGQAARLLRPLLTPSPSLVPSTELVRFEATADDGAVAAAVCNSFAQVFITRCLARIPPATEPSEANLKPIRDQITELQKKRGELLTSADITEIARKQALNSGQVEHFTSLRNKAAQDRIDASARLERLGKESADGIVERFARRRQQRLEDEKARDPLYQQASKEQVACARDYAAERGAGKTEQHRDVILAADRLHRAEAMVAKRGIELSSAVDAALAREQAAALADAKVEAAEAVKVADQQIADCDRKLADLDTAAKALGAERAQHEAMRAQLDQVDADLLRENHHLDEVSAEGIAKLQPRPSYQMRVVRRAEVPPPGAPVATAADVLHRRITIASATVGGGFCVGLILTFATGALRAPRHPAQQIAQILPAPLLGSIPLAGPMKRSTPQQQKAVQLRIAEGFRHLRNALTVLIGPTPSGEPHTLGVASARRGDGRSCIAAGLAISLAKSGQRVLLIDADLRKPDLHRMFSLPLSPGLCGLIEGKADPGDAIIRTDTANLSLLPAGVASVDPGELLAWQEIGNYLAALSRHYDQVILDAAPLLETADSHHLFDCIQGAVLVAIPSADPADVQRAMEILRSKKAKMLGAVMNRA